MIIISSRKIRWYSHRMWPNEVYFFVDQHCCALDPMSQKNVNDSRYNVIITTFQLFTFVHRDVGKSAPLFPGLLYFTLDPYLIMLSVKQREIKYHFWVFGMTRPGIEPRSPRPLANTLTAWPMDRKQLFSLWVRKFKFCPIIYAMEQRGLLLICAYC